jgi:hypothetical protein
MTPIINKNSVTVNALAPHLHFNAWDIGISPQGHFLSSFRASARKAKRFESRDAFGLPQGYFLRALLKM